jgi:hypothetical protein
MQGTENEGATGYRRMTGVSKPDSFCPLTNIFVELGNAKCLKTIERYNWHISATVVAGRHEVLKKFARTIIKEIKLNHTSWIALLLKRSGTGNAF